MLKDELIRKLVYNREDWAEDTLAILFLSDKLRELAEGTFETPGHLDSGHGSAFMQHALEMITLDCSGLSLACSYGLLDAIIARHGTEYLKEYAKDVENRNAWDLKELDDRPF